MELLEICDSSILKDSCASESMHILIVDDDATNRFVLQTMLKKTGHTVCSAGDGLEAIETYKKELPDLILMDVMMPRMDGLEATKQIKALIVDQYVPIIFLTALSDEQALAKCVSAGGDDFLTKPYKKDLLGAKLDAHIRLRILYNTAKKQRDELHEHNERVNSEQVFAQKIYQNMVHAGSLDNSNINYSMSSMALFNGDVVFGAKTPSGRLHIMLGDFTGHGLSAAIGAVPLSSIFYTMTAKGFAISVIVEEMNRKLKALLPLGIFCAACIYELDISGGSIRVWNGGIPGAYICDSINTKIRHEIKSTYAPLGIKSPELFDSTETVFEIEENDRIFLCTDGVTEARSPSGEMFGSARLESVLVNGKMLGDGFNAVQVALKEFRQEVEQDDDMTLIEVVVDPEQICENVENIVVQNKDSEHGVSENSEWDLSLKLDLSTLRLVDPIPLLNQFIVDLSCKSESKQEIFLILSELITNSIDHGILGLDSVIKNESEGFVKYYELRKKRMEEMDAGSIQIKLKHIIKEGGGYLLIHIKDSGDGFDHKQNKLEIVSNKNPSGRGIPLVSQLCQSINYRGKGNEVEAVYNWGD